MMHFGDLYFFACCVFCCFVLVQMLNDPFLYIAKVPLSILLLVVSVYVAFLFIEMFLCVAFLSHVTSVYVPICCILFVEIFLYVAFG